MSINEIDMNLDHMLGSGALIPYLGSTWHIHASVTHYGMMASFGISCEARVGGQPCVSSFFLG